MHGTQHTHHDPWQVVLSLSVTGPPRPRAARRTVHEGATTAYTSSMITCSGSLNSGPMGRERVMTRHDGWKTRNSRCVRKMARWGHKLGLMHG